MPKDISKGTLAVLLILVIAFSVIGTWIAMNKGPAIIDMSPEQTSSNTAKVSLTIEENTPPDSGEGKISLIIEPKKGG